MKEIVGASSQPGVISTLSGEKPVVVLTLLLQEGPSTQQLQVRLIEKQAAGLMRVLQGALDQMDILQKPPGRTQ